MIRHYGVLDAPFFVRDRRSNEPESMPNGHPWGWVYKIEDVAKDECRYLSAQEMQEFTRCLSSAIEAQETKRREMSSCADLSQISVGG